MLTCKKCNVKIAGSPECCPLCHGDLVGNPEPENNVLPVIDTSSTPVSILKAITALFIVLSIASVGFNAIFLEHVKWSILVIFGLCCLWVSVYIFLKYRRNTIKNIFLQTLIVIVLACCLDNLTGYHKWANSYVVPIVLTVAVISSVLVARVQRLNIGDYLFYFLFNCAIGVYSFRYTMYATKQITVVYPTAICFVVSLSAIVLTLLFEHRLLMSELKRRLHF